MDIQNVDMHEVLGALHEVFDPSLPRLGPGDDVSTTRALETLLPERQRVPSSGSARMNVLDIGCGNGASTIQLARLLDADITALDNHQPYLDELMRRAGAAGVADKIRPCCMDMCDLGRGPGSSPNGSPYDLIWSEGALYCVGFVQGLSICHSLLVPGGAMAVTELCWMRPDPPAECARFFAEEYPPMTGIANNLATIRAAGFEVVEHFTLPESAWRDSYYAPMGPRVRMLREQRTDDPQLLGMLDLLQVEIDTYDRFSACYGYEFFLMRR